MPKQTETKSKPKRERDPMLALRMSPTEMAAFQACAKVEERAVGNFVRLAALRGLAEYKRDPRALIDSKTS